MEVNQPAVAPAHDQRVRVALLRVISTIGPLPLLLLAVIIFFSTQESRFYATANILNVSRQATYLTIITLGQALVLMSGGFDLSVGALIAVTSVVSARWMSNFYAGHPEQDVLAVLVGVAAGLLVGLIFGLINGIGVARFKVSPFIMTLGMASIGSGFALYYTGGSPVSGMPPLFTKEIGTGRWLGIPVPIFFAVAAVVVMYFVMNWTRLGRYVYAIGGNTKAAYLSGISVAIFLASVYVICSLLTSLAGILLTARVSSGEPNLGASFALESITAAVVGGVSLRGGEGRIMGAVLGAIFITILTNGMNLIRIESYVQEIAVGVILIVAVIVDRLRDRYRA
ncbi:MAG: ABC transporter permease [Thermomicrobiales bacterium]|nr:ABC transporter permease [Thermomicrobiales bacterium]